MPLTVYFTASLESLFTGKPMLVVSECTNEDVVFEAKFDTWLKEQCDIWASLANNPYDEREIQTVIKLKDILKENAAKLEKALEANT